MGIEVDPIDWLKGTVCSVPDVLLAWEHGALAEVPAGRNWDVVRTTILIGLDSADRLNRAGHLLGPVLLNRPWNTVEFLVRPGTSSHWDMPETTCIGEGERLQCPHPGRAASRSTAGVSWLISPHRSGALTNADALYRAVGASFSVARPRTTHRLSVRP